MLTTYVTNLIPKLVVDATSFNRMALQLTAHAMQDWLHATAMTLLQSLNGHQTRQILICLIIVCWVPRWKLDITSWTNEPPTIEELQTRLEMAADRPELLSGFALSVLGYICCVNCTKFGKLILTKITKIFATRCQIFRLKYTKFHFTV